MRVGHALCLCFFFFFNGTATTEIYTLSLHDALPICGNLLLRILRINIREQHSGAHTPEEIELLAADSQAGGLLTPGARHMLRNSLRLRDLNAGAIMTPREIIVATSSTSSVSSVLRICLQTGFSRIPIFQDNVSRIVGFVHIKDLLRSRVDGTNNTSGILRTVTFIPETMNVAAIWERITAQNQQDRKSVV